MAERIVSPGVFTREKDLSFLPQAIGEIGAAIVGPTQKGPAFVPTIVRSFNEFVEVFGDVTKDFYTPYAVEQYLRSAGTVTIVRVLGEDGYSNDVIKLYAISASARTLETLSEEFMCADAIFFGTCTITGFSSLDSISKYFPLSSLKIKITFP